MAESQSTPVESWKPVVGFEALYSVSNIGRVRREMPAKGTRPGFILKPNSNGYYLRVRLSSNGDCRKYWLVHCLVAAAFIGPKPHRFDVNHKDGNKLNNVVENLEYLTRGDNMRHAYDVLGRDRKPGERNPFCQFSDATIRSLRDRRAAGDSYSKLIKQFGISKTHVARLCHNQARSSESSMSASVIASALK